NTLNCLTFPKSQTPRTNCGPLSACGHLGKSWPCGLRSREAVALGTPWRLLLPPRLRHWTGPLSSPAVHTIEPFLLSPFRGAAVATKTGVNQASHISQLFLDAIARRNDARECAERFISGLARTGLWEADELDELRQLIADGIEWTS